MAPDTGSEHPVEGIIDDYLAQRISRRDVFKRAGAIGLSVSAAASILAACGGGRSGSAIGSASVITGSGTTDAGPIKKGGQLIEGYDRDFSPHQPGADPVGRPGLRRDLRVHDGP